MATVSTIASEISNLSFSWEDTPGVLEMSPVWYQLEPNSFSDFGGEITTVARAPIGAGRQRKKGVTTDVEAGGGWQTDLTQENFQDLIQGFFYADNHAQLTHSVTDVDGTTEDFDVASGGTDWVADDLLWAVGFDADANNGLHIVDDPQAMSVGVTSNLTTAAMQTGTITRVGHQYDSGDLSVSVAGTWPRLVSAANVDPDDLGLTEGEWIFVGGDAAMDASEFTNAANNGWKRIRSLGANYIEIDQSSEAMVVDAGMGKTIQIFFASKFCKNEADQDLILKKSIQVEVTLGAPDDSNPTEIQAEYLVGAHFGSFTMNVPTADKVTLDLEFVALERDFRDAPTGPKSEDMGATYTEVEEADCFNTSTDWSNFGIQFFTEGTEAAGDLFTYLENFTLTVENNLQANKAVGVLGAFDISAGEFHVSGQADAYFTNVSQVEAVQANTDCGVHGALVKDNAGIFIDCPLVTLAGASPTIEKNQPIKSQITFEAAASAAINENTNYTIWWGFFDYLPDAAMPA